MEGRPQLKSSPTIAVLYGGISGEREVSLGSGKAAMEAFSRLFDVELFKVNEGRLPDSLDPEKHVVFSTLHGVFGEDGQVQRLMDSAGVAYAGCDAASSELTFDKVRTKRILADVGVTVLEQIVFDKTCIPNAEAALRVLGGSVVLKPRCQGSSLGLSFLSDEASLSERLANLEFDRWIMEPKVEGREVTIGVLQGHPLEIVEIKPKSGEFDYNSKYTKGLTDYLVPAPLEPNLTKQIKEMASLSYKACGCRDFVRVDFMIDKKGRPSVLELNTLPGLKETSLLPMSAQALGMDFESLLAKLVEPAFQRFNQLYPIYQDA